jgi:chromosome segregation ATPase
VKFPESCGAAAQLLFGDVLVAQNLAQAREAKRRWGNRCRAITLQGEMADTHGILSGGSHTEGGLLSRKREIADLEASLEKCRRQQTTGEARREELKRRREDLRETLDRARQERHECTDSPGESGPGARGAGAQRERLLRSQDQVFGRADAARARVVPVDGRRRLVVERIDGSNRNFTRTPRSSDKKRGF